MNPPPDFEAPSEPVGIDTERLQAILGPRYRIEREIGRGGMATVYLAEEPRHERRVAIKVLHTHALSSDAPERFLQEIRVTAGFSHPHILPLLDSGVAEGIPYYVMPYVAGESLRERLHREGPLPLQDVLRLATEIADALDVAHRHGVIHRDIKPANVLLEEGHAVIADFGLVRAIGRDEGTRITSAGVAMGTPAYMSPEQASGERSVDQRADVYALGCVIYEMLGGEPPYNASSVQALMAKKLSLPAPPVSTFREALSPEVDAVLSMALSRTPADRYATAGELASALEHALQGAHISERRGPSRPRVVLTSAVVVATLAALGLGGWWLTTPRLPDLDDGKVVVFPLDDGQGGTQDGLLAAQLIEGVLEHTEYLKLVDGWSRLEPGPRADISTLGPNAARAVALGQGARYYIAGRLMPRGDSLHAYMMVQDARGDSTVAQATGVGVVDLPVQLSFQVLTRLLPGWLDPGRQVDLSPVRDRSPGAVANWIKGEREYRLGHFAQARTLFQAAVDADSLLAFAALKGAEASLWLEDAEGAKSFTRLAVDHIDLLPAKHRLLARGLDEYWEGNADSSVTALRAALELSPDWQEAWAALGETYLHLIPSDARGDSISRDALERAWRLDPEFNPPLIHLAEFALRRGDLELGSRLVTILTRARPNEDVIAHLALMRDCVAGKVGPDEWRSAARLDPGMVLSAAKRLSEGGSQLPCAEGGFQALWEGTTVPDAYRWAGALGLQAIYVAESRFRAARTVVDSARAWVGLGSVAPYLVVATRSGAPFSDELKEWDRGLTERHGLELDGVRTDTRWGVTAWRFSQGDTGGVRAAVTAVEAMPDTAGSDAERVARKAMLARSAVLAGRRDDALEILATLSPAVPQWDLMWSPLASLPLERMLRARLLLERGRAAEALEIAAVFDHPAPLCFLELLPASLALRRDAALALDSTALAARYTDRLSALKDSRLP